MSAAIEKPRRILGVFTLAMINVSIMLSLRSLPLIAELGMGCIVYFISVAVLFLLPTALVSAELATGWPKSGGIYLWVREALGERWGFFSIWMQWVHNIAWFPVILSFVATTAAYAFFPALTGNKMYIFFAIQILFWGMTLLNYLGISVSCLFSSSGVIAGTLVPGLGIITLACIWYISGKPIALSSNDLLPQFEGIHSLVFLSGLFLAFGGLEASASLANEVKSPQRSYPKAVALASVITFCFMVFGALAISVIVPKDKLSLVAGLMEAFALFLPALHLDWMLPLIAILLVLGALAETNSWIVAPIKGLHAAAIRGNLPSVMHKTNSNGVPTTLLIVQASIVTAASFVFLFVPTISSGFWILTALSAQSYLIMYVMMFIAAIRLRYSHPHVPRVYKIPIPHKGIWIASILGAITCIAAIGLSFLPPKQLSVVNSKYYGLYLFAGLAVMCAAPLVFFALEHRKTKKILYEENS